MGALFNPPQYTPPPPDPALATLNAQSTQQNNQAIQTQVQSDSARIMAMYGATAAMGGQTGSITTATPSTIATGFGAPGLADLTQPIAPNLANLIGRTA